MVDYIDGHRDEFGVESICKVMQVAPSTYYAARKRRVAPSDRAVRDAVMLQVLVVLWVTNRKVYGAHKLCDNALAETTNGLYKTECVYGPDATARDDVDQLELETLSWVHWFNHDRLHSHCDDVPPAELEAAFYAGQQAAPIGVGNQ